MCGGCELVYAVPRPAPAEPETGGASAILFEPLEGVFGYGSDFVPEEGDGQRAWELLAPPLAKRLPTPGRLLDVHCGSGDFLAQAKGAGWSVVGVETSEEAAREARERHSLDIRPDGIREVILEDDSFDIITMRHILERLIEPGRALIEAQRALKPGGWLWIQTLNWNSRGRIRRGMRWERIHPPQRINYFTPRSLCTAVERAGLEVAALHTGPRNAPAPSSGLRTRLSIRLAGLFGWGEQIRMWARKPSR
jgi:SAM-dependent methyltransferase